MRVCVYTLGCRLNQCESEAIADAFKSDGFSVVNENEECELYLVNTCTVTSKAEQKARRMIRLFLRRGAVVIITGCYAQMNQEELEALSERAVVVPLEKKAGLLKLASHLKSAMVSGLSLLEATKSFADTSVSPFDYKASSFTYHSRAYLKIQDGCDNECAYCRVHIARGASVSLSEEDVIKRALELEAEGFHEIVLTGVNLTMYDHERGGLGGLLLKLLPLLKEDTRLRLSSMEPDHIDEKLIEACRDKRMHPHFHIPLQSASDKVLTRVNRKYSKEHLEWVISSLREVKDDPFIACDVITGLPGEGDEEFKETAEFLSKQRFAAMHVFPFSPRPDTPLFNAKDRCEERVRDERAEVLRELSEKLSKEYIQRQIGKEVEVLLENRKNGYWQGTSGNYLKVRIDTGVSVHSKGDLVKGKLVEEDLVVL